MNDGLGMDRSREPEPDWSASELARFDTRPHGRLGDSAGAPRSRGFAKDDRRSSSRIGERWLTDRERGERWPVG